MDEDAIRVAALDIKGAQAFTADSLRRILETRKAGPWPWVRWRPFDEAAFERDLDRLRAFYHDRGFDDAVVRATRVDLADDRRSVRLEITIDEGTPIVVESVAIDGVASLPAPLSTQLTAIDPGVGRARDLARMAGARDTALRLLRDQGYPHASVDIVEAPGQAPRSVAVRLRVSPGAETRFGDLRLNGLSRTKHVVVRRALTFRPGDLYRESEVVKSQRRLLQMGAFEFAHLAPDAEAKTAAASPLPMVVTVAEAKPHRFEVGVGYGTEDRLRGSVEWRNVNFYGNGSQWVGTARYSTVLRGAGFGYDHPYLLRSGGTLDVRAGAWWTEETTFSSRAAGGQIAVSHDLGARDLIDVRSRYRYEFLTYRVSDAVLDDIASIEERIALGLDPATGRGDGTVTGIEITAVRTALDNESDPARGSAFGVTAEHVAPWLGGSFRYDELAAEARVFVPLVASLRLAGKARYGTLSSASTASVPFAERFFLGGASSLRGWGRYEVGPTSGNGVPVGGRSMLDASLELRASLCCAVGAVAFLDVGNVWAQDWTVRPRDLRYAAGGGLRYQSIVGVVRADVGYQLTPIARLRLDGKPQSRRWRLHISIGHAF